MQSRPRRGSGTRSSIDLQRAIVRHLPIPILLLSPSRTAVFANGAAEKLLLNLDQIPSPEHIYGQHIEQLGVKLLLENSWKPVLDQAQHSYLEDVSDGRTHEVRASISSSEFTSSENVFTVSVTILPAEDGPFYLLSFLQPPAAEVSIPKRRAVVSSSTLAPDVTQREGIGTISASLLRMKMAIFDSSNVAIFMLTADEQYYLTNKKFRELLGTMMGGPGGIDGPSLRTQLQIWDENFTRKLAPAEFPALRITRQREHFSDYRFGFVHQQTGNRVVVAVTAECLYDEDTGDFVGAICWCKDLQQYEIFMSVQQQRRLESHETICNLMPHMVWTNTPSGLCDYFSERWYEFTGMTREESLGNGFQAAIHPADTSLLLSKFENHRISGDDYSVEIRYRRHDGIYRWMLCRAVPLRAPSGEILKWYGTNTDIHDLVMARIEASRNKLQMLTVLAHAEVMLFSINQERIITMAEGGMSWDASANAYSTEYGLSLIGKDAIQAAQEAQPGGIPDYEKNVLDILAGKVDSAQSEDSIGNRLYRTRVVAEIEHNPIDGAKKPEVIGVLGLSIDVTDMKRRAALEVDNSRLTKEEQAAKDSNKMKSQFLANMSHEMRTPTAGVIGLVELLSDDPTLTPSQRSHISSIQLSARALLTIVNDILDFSKIESGRLDIESVPFDLRVIVTELVKLLRMFAKQKDLELIYENEMERHIEVMGDPGRIRQVLSNLLTNALKFTKEGSIRLTVTSSTLQPATPATEEILQVKFVVRDTGIGIARETLNKLFRPFSQGDASTARLYGGTGLGLTISRNLASLMNGTITLESVPNKGSTATFIVPLQVSSRDFRSSSPQSPTRSRPSSGMISLPSAPWSEPLAERAVNSDILTMNLLNQQIGSSVTQYSSPGLGSTSRSASIDLARPLTPEQRSKIHVLVVEDNAINQTIALANIRRLGFSTAAVWNGYEALSYLLSPSVSRPHADIVLMDVQMPEMDGYEATRLLRYITSQGPTSASSSSRTSVVAQAMQGAHDPNTHPRIETILSQLSPKIENLKEPEVRQLAHIPVIAMTASAIQGDRDRCVEAGMDDYLAKPVERKALEGMLIKWAARIRDGGSK